MTESVAKHSTAPSSAPTLNELDRQAPVRVIRGRNSTKAVIRIFDCGDGAIAVKDYRECPWWFRATGARWLVRRETAAYLAAGPLPGLPRCLGRLGPLTLATEWIDARPLAEIGATKLPVAVCDRLEALVRGLHERGVALGDLHHRDVLIGSEDEVHVVDLATAWVRNARRGDLRNWIFARWRAADSVALARIRARFTGESEENALRGLDSRAVAWHRRGRAAKRLWDRLRGADRPPDRPVRQAGDWAMLRPVTDRPTPEYNRPLGILRVVAVYGLIGFLVLLARPTPLSVSVGFCVAALGEAIRLWAAGHLCKTVELITSGPYRYTRNPLYLGRLLILTGLCIMAPLPYRSNWIALGLGYLVFFGYYLRRKERVEPARLRQLHGEAYELYFRAVPALFPTPSPYAGGPGLWSSQRMLRNREHWMVIGILAVTLFLLWRAYSPGVAD